MEKKCQNCINFLNCCNNFNLAGLAGVKYYGTYPKPCDKFKTTYTNRQWLESLSDEELAELLNSDFCRLCKKNALVDCDNNCEQATLDWLQAEHKE